MAKTDARMNGTRTNRWKALLVASSMLLSVGLQGSERKNECRRKQNAKRLAHICHVRPNTEY